jgi:hypothetical protein
MEALHHSTRDCERNVIVKTAGERLFEFFTNATRNVPIVLHSVYSGLNEQGHPVGIMVSEGVRKVRG